MAENRKILKIQDVSDGIGEVRISDEVVTIIAALAATEIEGVASLTGNITNELVSRLSKKSLSRGVRVAIIDGMIHVDLSLIIRYGENLLETSKAVQERVKSTVENMTGLIVADVNIRIAGVDMEMEKGK